MVIIIGAFALLVVSLLMLLLLARKTPTFRSTSWPVVTLLTCSAILFGVRLRAMDRETKRLDVAVARWNSRVDGYCDALASGLVSAVTKYRVMRAEASGFTPSDVIRAETEYMEYSSERDRFARMCVPDVAPGEWRECVPRVLSDKTLDKIERAAKAIDEHKVCDP